MRRPEDLEMESEQFCEENIYANTCDLDVQRRKNTPKAKEIPAARSTEYRATLTLGVLLTLAFIALVILTSFFFIYYKSIKEEMSHLKNSNSGLTKDVSDLQKSDSGLTKDVSDLQKSVTNMTDDLNELKLIINKGKSSCCPEGWLPIGANCYYFPQTLETWEKSREECTKNYSILLILKNKNELDSLLPFLEGDRYWIGLRRDTKDSSRWLWIDGAPLTFSAWAEGEPNNAKDNENCAEIRKSVRSLNDVPCDTKKHYICKVLSRC
ncbi:C-type lectin domain family 4 member G-like isoform X2 [Lithobates pipiens]